MGRRNKVDNGPSIRVTTSSCVQVVTTYHTVIGGMVWNIGHLHDVLYECTLGDSYLRDKDEIESLTKAGLLSTPGFRHGAAHLSERGKNFLKRLANKIDKENLYSKKVSLDATVSPNELSRLEIDSSKEMAIATPAGQYLVFPHYDADSNGVSYLRFVDRNGKEMLYYDANEWSESRSQGEEVMGAILGAMIGGANLSTLSN